MAPVKRAHRHHATKQQVGTQTGAATTRLRPGSSSRNLACAPGALRLKHSAWAGRETCLASSYQDMIWARSACACHNAWRYSLPGQLYYRTLSPNNTTAAPVFTSRILLSGRKAAHKRGTTAWNERGALNSDAAALGACRRGRRAGSHFHHHYLAVTWRCQQVAAWPGDGAQAGGLLMDDAPLSRIYRVPSTRTHALGTQAFLAPVPRRGDHSTVIP